MATVPAINVRGWTVAHSYVADAAGGYVRLHEYTCMLFVWRGWVVSSLPGSVQIVPLAATRSLGSNAKFTNPYALSEVRRSHHQVCSGLKTQMDVSHRF